MNSCGHSESSWELNLADPKSLSPKSCPYQSKKNQGFNTNLNLL